MIDRYLVAINLRNRGPSSISTSKLPHMAEIGKWYRAKRKGNHATTAQLYDPLVLVHTASTLHLCCSAVDSFTSEDTPYLFQLSLKLLRYCRSFGKQKDKFCTYFLVPVISILVETESRFTK